MSKLLTTARMDLRTTRLTPLQRDLHAPKPLVYWGDTIASAAIGWAALAGAILLTGAWAWLSGIVAVFALYRAASFIHEVSHLKHAELPHYRLGWNLLVGVPMLIPSFMYEGVHNLHHAKTRYGTVEDPEYLPLALMKPWTLPLFIVSSALAPVALLFRFAVLTPLGLVVPALRTLTRDELERLSSPARMTALRAIKAALDPLGILNPGKLVQR